MRLIDADALEQEIDAMWDIGFTPEKVIEKLRKAPTVDDVSVVRCSDCKYRRELTLMDFCNIVRFAPTVDAVSVVRCKDCKFRFDGHYCNCGCWHTMIGTEDDDFCSMGERRD